MKPLLYLPWDCKFNERDVLSIGLEGGNSLYDTLNSRRDIGTEVRNTINMVDSLLELWVDATNPFGLDPMKHIFLPSMTREVRAARQYVLDNGYAHFFKESDTVHVNVETHVGLARLSIIMEGSERVCTLPRIEAETLPPDVFEYLSKYSMNVVEAMVKASAINDHVKMLLRRTSTFGQLFTIWPDLYGFVGDGLTYSMAKKKARSALTSRQRSMYAARPEHIAYSTDILAEAYMMHIAGVRRDDFRRVNVKPSDINTVDHFRSIVDHFRNMFTLEYLDVFPQHPNPLLLRRSAE